MTDCPYPDCHVEADHTHRTVECAACASMKSGVCAWHIQSDKWAQYKHILLEGGPYHSSQADFRQHGKYVGVKIATDDHTPPIPAHMTRPVSAYLAPNTPEYRPDMVAVPRELLRECHALTLNDYSALSRRLRRQLVEVLGDD